MRYADYYDCDICNGNSVGMSLFVSGCPLHCQGCFNQEAWDFNYGKEWTQEIENKFINLVGREYIKRVSFLGGSPLCDDNIDDVLMIITKIKERYPDKKIWVFTGYTWEYLIKKSKQMNVLHQIDVLIDGPFEQNKKNLSLAFRGSTNQRIIDVQKTFASEDYTNPILWNGGEYD